MPYKDIKDKNEHNKKYYNENAESIKEKRRERYRKKKINERIVFNSKKKET